jgi:Protein of unknown function (DUF998)
VSRARSKSRAGLLSATALTGFVLATLAEHALNASLSPARHQISEYVHGRAGWLMVAGFVAWAVSLVATAELVRSWSLALSALLGVAAVGFVITAVWATQTSAGELPPGVERTTAGRLHDAGSGVASLAMLAAAVVSVRVGPVRRLRRLAIGVIGVAIVADVALLAVGASVGGVRQRVLVLAAVVWQAAVLTPPPHPEVQLLSGPSGG